MNTLESVLGLGAIKKDIYSVLGSIKPTIDSILGSKISDPSKITPANRNINLSPASLKSTQSPQLPRLTDQNKKVVATIIGEALGEGSNGMQAVLNVIQNRASKNKTTLFQEVSKPKQFTAFSPLNPLFVKTRDYLRGKPVKLSPQEQSAVDEVTKMISNKTPDITGGSTHYANLKTATDTSWTSKLPKIKQIGNHTFFK